MLDVADFRARVVAPTLRELDLWSAAAEALLVGTALVESGLRFLAQRRGGPALGLYQMEPATHDDLWASWLRYRPPLNAAVAAYLVPGRPRVDQLAWNLRYATAMARIHYRRVPALLPVADDVAGLAAYWKAHYNTAAGKGTAAKFVAATRRHLPLREESPP